MALLSALVTHVVLPVAARLTTVATLFGLLPWRQSRQRLLKTRIEVTIIQIVEVAKESRQGWNVFVSEGSRITEHSPPYVV